MADVLRKEQRGLDSADRRLSCFLPRASQCDNPREPRHASQGNNSPRPWTLSPHTRHWRSVLCQQSFRFLNSLRTSASQCRHLLRARKRYFRGVALPSLAPIRESECWTPVLYSLALVWGALSDAKLDGTSQSLRVKERAVRTPIINNLIKNAMLCRTQPGLTKVSASWSTSPDPGSRKLGVGDEVTCWAKTRRKEKKNLESVHEVRQR